MNQRNGSTTLRSKRATTLRTEGESIIAQINVANDTAERGMKLNEEFNNILTKDEERKQYLGTTNCRRLQKQKS